MFHTMSLYGVSDRWAPSLSRQSAKRVHTDCTICRLIAHPSLPACFQMTPRTDTVDVLTQRQLIHTFLEVRMLSHFRHCAWSPDCTQNCIRDSHLLAPPQLPWLLNLEGCIAFIHKKYKRTLLFIINAVSRCGLAVSH